MPTFSYKAVDQSGTRVEGTVVADNQQAVLGVLSERALFPVEVREGGVAVRSALGTPRRVRIRHLTAFYGQLADLLKAGVPVLRALDVLAKQSSNAALAEITREIREDVAGGSTLADAMGKHPRVFDELYLSMVRAGERGGFLEDVLSRIAQFTERQDELRNKLLGSMIYPIILVVIGTSLVCGLLVFVVPKLRPFLERAELNFLTRAVFAMCDLLQGYGVWILAGAALALISVSYYAQTESGRRRIDLVKLKMPVLGHTLVMIALCRFCRILGTMLSSGVPILQALRIARDSAGNEVLAAEIDKATDNVQRGGTISEPLAQCPLLPLDIVDMIAVAEESNNLESVLVQISDTNEARTARLIDMGVRLVEPILLVALAGIIGLIAVSLLLPILNMSSQMGG
jgi:general secretion pathway protein F/type IV pilus assembly protein PilC